MNFWLETIGFGTKREGKYLICPVHSSTRENYPLYKILEDLEINDIVFHNILERASKKPSAITSYSRVKDRSYFVDSLDSLCPAPPPYRRVNLAGKTRLKKPITMKMLVPFRQELELASKQSAFSRSPFDKNFRLKQLYLSRIPPGYLKIFEKLSKTSLGFNY